MADPRGDDARWEACAEEWDNQITFGPVVPPAREFDVRYEYAVCMGCGGRYQLIDYNGEAHQERCSFRIPTRESRDELSAKAEAAGVPLRWEMDGEARVKGGRR